MDAYLSFRSLLQLELLVTKALLDSTEMVSSVPVVGRFPDPDSFRRPWPILYRRILARLISTPMQEFRTRRRTKGTTYMIIRYIQLM